MKRCFLKLVLLICLIILSSVQSPAQFSKAVQDNLKILDVEHVQIITNHDKSNMIGRILEIREKEIRFKAEFGEMTIPIEKIISIEIVPITSIKEGVYWFPNPNATRLFFAPTARMLNKGDGYFTDYYRFFPAFTFAITNNITIGGGMSLIPGTDIDKQIFYFTPKFGLPATKNLNLGIGALIIKIPDSDDEGNNNESDNVKSPLVGILYGIGTYGNPNSSLTFGLG